MGKFTIELLCCFIVGVCCFFWRTKFTKEVFFSVYSNTGLPFSCRFIPTDSSVSACIRSTHFCVISILCMCGFTEIPSSIIECVAIFVVSFFLWCAVQNNSVHTNYFPFVSSDGIKAFGVVIPLSTPVPLVEPFEIFGVNDGVLPLRQWDKAIGLVERLNNCVSFHAAFHWSTSNGLLKFSRYFTLEGV